MRKLLSLVTFIILLTSCNLRNEGFTISGYIEGIKDSTLITLYDLDQQIDLDSSISNNGEFVLTGVVEQPTGCWIRCEGEYANIQVENVEISFKSPIKDMHLYSEIVGGREQELQNELKTLQRPYDLMFSYAYDSLVNQKYSNEIEMQNLIKRFNGSQSTSHEIYVNYGIQHSDSYMGLNIVYMNRNSIPQDTLLSIYNCLPTTMKETQVANALSVFLFEESAKESSPFIDFEAQTIDGEEFKLSSLKGKYIYLCFWSAGCAPCRMENKFISKHFSEVPKELSIVSFSIDKNIDAWQNASEADSIIWHNVSDNEGTKGRIKTQYQVQAIPTSFLIDKEGIIVRKFKGFDQNRNVIEDLRMIISGMQ